MLHLLEGGLRCMQYFLIMIQTKIYHFLLSRSLSVLHFHADLYTIAIIRELISIGNRVL